MSSIAEQYNLFQKMERVVHGTKICEGNLWQNLIYETIRDHGHHFNVVIAEHRVALNPVDPTHRKTHRVDIWCQDDTENKIFAFNSKGKSFNNTESQESLLNEYLAYKRAIQAAYPGYEIVYAILKDEYSTADTKLGKYHFLTANGIPVYNTANYLEKTLGVCPRLIEVTRQMQVIQILRKRMSDAGVSLTDLCSLMVETEEPMPSMLTLEDLEV